ncbi:hypothetical protein ATHL_03220 [Anaerolinea thermolimosa]|uniref:Uncharacterized protein n=1 Tax=Anaerolinea thermolimosa TaxID=229919 RepID=A0A7U9KN89_9CHLR|nr:hypothetical protein ATHL_03220 [Anaerolinea thermolimosa]
MKRSRLMIPLVVLLMAALACNFPAQATPTPGVLPLELTVTALFRTAAALPPTQTPLPLVSTATQPPRDRPVPYGCRPAPHPNAASTGEYGYPAAPYPARSYPAAAHPASSYRYPAASSHGHPGAGAPGGQGGGDLHEHSASDRWRLE